MKNLLIFFILSYTYKSFALEGVVRVLQTPLFEKRSINSKIKQYLRKGKKIFIVDFETSTNPTKINYENPYERNFFEVTTSNEEFYETIDRNGEKAYVLSKHLKVIYKDERELVRIRKKDPYDSTDYRLEEPLPRTYPISIPNRYRSILAYTFGPQRKINYPYLETIKGEQFKPVKGVNFHYTKKVVFDPYDRFYYGLSAGVNSTESSFQLSDDSSANESTIQVLTGPYFSYDAYRKGSILLSFAGGLSFNFMRTSVTLNKLNISEQRSFKNLSISPRLGSYLQFKKYLKIADIIFGGELISNIPFNLKSSDKPENPEIWNPANDKIKYELGAQFSMFIGLQATIE